MDALIKYFNPLNISPLLFFKGTDPEKAKARAKEEARAAELEKVFFSADFIAAEYTNGNGQKRILHHSTRPGVLFQLSYIDADGIPAMHENYINIGADPENVGSIHDKRELLKHFISASNAQPLQLKILTT